MKPITSPTSGECRSGWALRVGGVCVCLLATAFLAACADKPMRTQPVADAIRSEIAATQVPKPSNVVPARISDALAEPAPPPVAAPREPRIDLLVNNANAREVFLSIVSDTRFSMLMHPDVSGTISVTLRGVTVKEALESIRDVYGYDFKIEGRRIIVYAPTLQTRIFTVNYPFSQRQGRSETRVSAGSTNAAAPGAVPGATGAAPVAGGAVPAGGAQTRQNESSRVSTSSNSDFWAELADSVRSLVGSAPGRNVVVSPQAGVMAVRAMPEELRQVEKFLKATQLSVERQVMLEAKIVEVELRDGFQSGINWGAFSSDANLTTLVGVLGSGIASSNPLLQSGVSVGAVPIPSVAAGGGLFGLALATSQFAAVMGFLETQGNVQTLSSPRIATLNNQKAVLKVGSDDFFVTNVSGGSTNTAGTNTGTTTTLPSLTLTPFFSGVALDVTPQVDDGNTIMLHVHPSVSSVTERNKDIDLGSVGQFRLPLASSSVNETDTMVRIQDGNIVAIGGLMQSAASNSSSGLPGTTNTPFSFLFGNKAVSARKKEVVVLIKPTIIRTASDWETQTQRSRAALDDIEVARSRVIRLDGSISDGTPKATVK